MGQGKAPFLPDAELGKPRERQVTTSLETCPVTPHSKPREILLAGKPRSEAGRGFLLAKVTTWT